MKWFRKDKELLTEQPQHFTERHQGAIEIVAHKTATEEAKKEIDEANKKLKKIFEHNHFTVKLYVAAGGRKPKQTGAIR